MKKRFYVAAVAALLVGVSACGKHDPMPVGETQGQTVAEAGDGKEEGEDGSLARGQGENQEASQEEGFPLGETGGPEALSPIDIDISEEFISEWQEGKLLIQGSSSVLHVLNDGYGALQKSLKEYNEMNQAQVTEVYQEYLESARERSDDQDFFEFEISREIVVERSDSQIVSFVNFEQSYLGGAHGSYDAMGGNLEPASGRWLSLRDVVRDYDQVYEYAQYYLERGNDAEDFFPDYQDTLHNLFYGDSTEKELLDWSMDMEKVTLYFSPYLLGPYASGMFTVEIPFSGQEQLVKEEYIPKGKGKVIKANEGDEIILNRNGQEESLFYTVSVNEENYSSIVSLCMGGQTAQEELYGSVTQAFVFQKPEGGAWLYVECEGDNDWLSLHVFDLNQAAPKYAGQGQGHVGAHPVSNPENFTLYSRLDLLGTYEAFRHYRVGDDGLPQALEEMYTIVNYDRGNGEYVLTSTVELPVEMYSQAGAAAGKTQETLPAGTRYYLRKTDGETFVEMELEDGRRCKLAVERGGEFFSRINGMEEEDCFEGFHYAG